MECKKISSLPKEGRLAFPYIVYQEWPEKIYDYSSGLCAGTIFPELNQPAMYFEWGELYK